METIDQTEYAVYKVWRNWIIGIVAFVFAIIILNMWVSPIYRVWNAHKHGEAEYAQAEQNRKIKILEAQANNEAATSAALARVKQATAEAEAEIVRAGGVAKANEIIAGSLQGNESYLRYLWIDKISGGHETIYVPTEVGLPILEAGKR